MIFIRLILLNCIRFRSLFTLIFHFVFYRDAAQTGAAAGILMDNFFI